MASPEDPLILVGKVVRPHGVDGRLRIRSFARSEESFLTAETVFMKCGSGAACEYRVLSVSPHKNLLLLKLEGLDSLDEAEDKRGAEIYIRRAASAPGEEEEFFWHELIGLEVFLDTGRRLGTLRDIIPTGANDIYVVKDGTREILIPAVHDVVEEVDVGKGRMIVREMEGLLDLNEI